ncbi:transposase [Burkholderia sp. WAC0059]|uniref:transposase n=1 Tax=Burkholderia sp. WAC0059 TaxID=2066022 RepID=UPI0011AF1E59|nr:transposase [Burkholderia sp. WAC0059]
MNFEELSDEEWMQVASLVSDEPPIRLNRRGRPRAEPRVVTNAVLWILTTGESWSRLPARYPSGPTCRRRFDEWHLNGTLAELVQLLSTRGRAFVYVPEAPPPETHSAEASAGATADDDGLPTVFWKSPQAWQAPTADAPEEQETGERDWPVADAIVSMTRQLSNLQDPDDGRPAANPSADPAARDVLNPAARAGAVALPSPVAVPSPAVDVVTAARPLWSGAAAQSVQVAEWRGYLMKLVVQPVRNRMFRSAVEILRDGQRLERSGLVGPPFADRESAKQFAFDWARKWVEHECRGEVPAMISDASTAARAAATGGVVTRSMPPGDGRWIAPVHRYTPGSLPPLAADGRESSTAEPRHPVVGSHVGG